jgi:hypothetical protein
MIREAQKSKVPISILLFDCESKKKEEYMRLARNWKGVVRVIAANERVLKGCAIP